MEGDTLQSFSQSVHIAAPSELVWTLITNVGLHPEFAGPKSITKKIEPPDQLTVGARWIANEEFGPNKFDAASEVTALEPERLFEWVSFPPVKSEEFRGEGGKVIWGFRLEPSETGTRLEHYMSILEPKKGRRKTKLMVWLFRKKRVEGAKISLNNIKSAAEQATAHRSTP